MNEIITTSQSQLPETIPDLAKFVLIGRDKLKAVRAEIHAIDKVGMARDVYQQKLEEAQEIAEVVTDAECRMGELIREIPKATKDNARKQISPHVDLIRPKSEVIKESGLSQRQAEHFQFMANHPESVEKAKAKARQEGTVLSRNAVIQQIVSDTKPKDPIREMERKAEERHEEFDASGKTVSFEDIKQDKEDRELIGNRAYIQISNTCKAIDAYVLFKQEAVKCIPESIPKTQLEHFRQMLKRQVNNLNKILSMMEEVRK